MIKKLALSLLFLTTATYSMEQQSALMVPSKLGNINLYHDDNGFKVIQEQGDMVDVQPAFVDKELRGLSNEKLHGLMKAGCYLKLNQMENGPEYSVKLGQRLPGAGLGGMLAGFWIGRTVVYGTAYGTIGLVSAFTGPAAPATFATLSAIFAPGIEATATSVQLGCAIAGAVATGPA